MPVRSRKPVAATPAEPGAPAPLKPKRSPAKPRAPKAAGTPKTGAGDAASVRRSAQPLSILMVSSEAHPFAKSGGLAEVAGALPMALAQLGHRVTLMLPRYRGTDVSGESARPVTLNFGVRKQPVSFYTRSLADNVTAVLVDAPELFDRAGLYGEGGLDYDDNGWRFAVLSLAALEYARQTGERPSVIHAHDWQTGMVPVFQKMLMATDRTVGGVPVVFTIHNLAFQGVFPASMLPAVGLGWDLFDVQALEYLGADQLPEGGHQLQRADHDGQPDVRTGNSHAGARIRLRRDPPRPREQPQRDPEWHRHRALEPGGRPARPRPFHRRGPVGKARRQTGPPRGRRPFHHR